MQKGFTLLEMLMVSLFGGLLLLAASQVIINLINTQADQSELLRLAENAMLAELVLKKEISEAKSILLSGEAINSRLVKTSESNLLTANNLNNEIKFNQFKNSDWLLLYTTRVKENNNCDNKYIILHIDKKEYAYGLSYKYYEIASKGTITNATDKTIELDPLNNPILSSDTSRSDTLVSQIELIRFRYFYEQESKWIKSNEILDYSLIKKVQFAFIIGTNNPVKKQNPNYFTLWDEIINLPKDGIYRQLVTAIVNLKGVECIENTTKDLY
ncbi:MAG TPA: prepilin-type N-terminal cleavage/methylation domain-containing protein [Marinospirillum sp.]|uniref:prepilin-type N-terminal cleavage/methylation domain-containing protein n=1 Tax=Marinospirillum sp. TaxID=2183934 RepID=UPI002B47A74F|nr:prepilin-type N-terminal cleavage/methylation domain-containing protein [Marinospirillum sp.]HKM16302.1 prepilin-type N-terminal cleavage/methylation domain-containing protein [Marinospirillum sp.]